jgi:hypothetical protein
MLVFLGNLRLPDHSQRISSDIAVERVIIIIIISIIIIA